MQWASGTKHNATNDNRVTHSHTADYTIYVDGTSIYAECNVPSGTDYNGTFGTDDATIINNALAALTNGGGVYIKQASTDYTIDAALEVPNDCTVYSDAMRAATLKIANSANVHCFVSKVNADDANSVGCHIGIKNLKIDGNKSNNTSGYGILLRAWQCRLENVEIYDATEHGIYFQAPVGESAIENVIRGCKVRAAGNNGIYFDSRASDNHVVSCIVNACEDNGIQTNQSSTLISNCHIYTNDDVGVYINGAAVGVLVANSYIEDNGDGIIIKSTGGNQVANVAISNCRIFQNDAAAGFNDAIHIANDASTDPDGILIENCILDTHRYNLRVDDGNHVIMKGCILKGPTTSNWLVDEGNNLIEGNYVTGTIGTLNSDTVVKNNEGYNPIGKIANCFDTTNDLIELNGDAATPTASTAYTIKNCDILISSTDSGNSDNAIQITDPSNNNINPAALSTLDAYYLPLGYKINWGAYTGAAPTVVVGFC